MRPRKHDPARPVIRAEVEASLARKIRIWAETWRRCPRKGCRRAGECQNFDDCAGVPKEPVEMPEADKRVFRAAIEKERVRRGLPPRPGYDPDARERDRPMPPVPPRIRPSPPPDEAEPPGPDPSRENA